MARKALTFLGYNPPDREYRRATYQWQHQPSPVTPFMALATAFFFPPDELLVLVTDEAHAANFADLRDALAAANLLAPTPVPIPSGKNEAELWQMFHTIADQIADGDTIIFDVTNGFRSLPILALLAFAYVRTVRRNVQLERIVYGAFDATVDGRTPVFDLTPFVQLFDWSTATSAFTAFGRANFAPLLTGTPTNSPQHALADHLKELSDSLYTSRTQQALRQAAALEQHIAAVKQQPTATAAPLDLLLEPIAHDYAPLGLADPTAIAQGHAALVRMLTIINWYLSKDMLLHAATLAREWLVSLVLYLEGNALFAGHKERDWAASMLVQHWRRNQPQPQPTQSATRQHLPRLRDLYRQAGAVRNDIAHCGMEPNARRFDTVEQQVRDLCAALPALLPAEGTP